MMASTSCSAIELGHQRLVAGLADHERHPLRHRPIESGREIVEHDHALAGIDQRVDHVASDIAGAAGDQDRHDGNRECLARMKAGRCSPRGNPRRATRLYENPVSGRECTRSAPPVTSGDAGV